MTSRHKKSKKSDINDDEVKKKDYKQNISKDSRKRKDSDDSDYDVKRNDKDDRSKRKKAKKDSEYDKRERKRSRSRSRSRSGSRSPEKKSDSDDERKKSSKRYENDYKERYDRRPERYQPSKRYWGADNLDPPYQKNSDRYWNKFSRDEDHYVGSRYYDVSEKKKIEKEREEKRERDRDNEKEKSKDTLGNEKDKPDGEPKKEEEAPRPTKKSTDLITSKTGGAYIPPAKLKMMQASIKDKSSVEYQRIAWEALKKSIHGLINKVNVSNLPQIIKQLFKENIVRGRGLLCKSIIQAQALSPTFTHVYAALVALINSRFPNIGELLLKRLVIQFRRGFKRNDKAICISATTFIAHLVNQKVAHEILALEILTLLVETPTDDSVEVAISFLKECGMKLTEVSSKGIEAIFAMLRNILHEGKLDKRVQYMIEVIFQIRKDKFKDHEAVIEELDVVEEEDQFTHLITLDDATNGEDILNVFKFDPEYTENEEKFKALSKEMLGESEESGSSDEDEDESIEEEEGDEEDEEKKQLIIDNTETNLISLRRTIYLTIYSSLDYEECAHKLMKMDFKPGQEVELCNMILDCCCEMRTYEKFFGLLAQRFCQINKKYIPPFQNMFKDSYDTVFRLKPNQLRNVAKFFAHLLFADAISWEVLSCIQLNEDDTTSSGRIFIKILFQELAEYMGLTKLNERVKDPTLQVAFSGLFPRDNPKNTRFAINFFTSIGLGGLTDDLREHLKSQMKAQAAFTAQPPSSSSSSSSNDSSSSSDSSDSSSESDSSDDDAARRKKKISGSKKSKNKKSETKSSSKGKNRTYSDSQSKNKSKSSEKRKSDEKRKRK